MVHMPIWGIAGIVGLLFFMLVSKSIIKPLQWVWYGLIYTALGGMILFLVNLLGTWFQFEIPINPVTAMIAGLLGLPGLFYLVCVKLFILG